MRSPVNLNLENKTILRVYPAVSRVHERYSHATHTKLKRTSAHTVNTQTRTRTEVKNPSGPRLFESFVALHSSIRGAVSDSGLSLGGPVSHGVRALSLSCSPSVRAVLRHRARTQPWHCGRRDTHCCTICPERLRLLPVRGWDLSRVQIRLPGVDRSPHYNPAEDW